ncbi:MAG: nicotinate phosphoribosyltransferase [Cyclobacteriaceae bacterium]
MSFLDKNAGIYTDHYELSMSQGYFLNGRSETPATFDYFFRKNPFSGGFVVFAGLQDLLDTLENLHFDEESLRYLASIGFHDNFIDYLSDFRFTGDIYAPPEGELVFPHEPVVRIDGNLIEAQILETLVLNILNFESLIATKTARMRMVCGERMLIDFGMRRAQGLGAVHASRAAMLGGADSTSNVYSGFSFGLPTSGTMAHSWVQSYEDELTAFRRFSEAFPQKCILLVDTYDTLGMGVPNAITVAREMEDRGQKLMGIRLDSGDLAYFSKQARKMLDDAGLEYVQIVASNQLDEYVIRSLNEQQAPIDAFGVGTRLITGRPDAALDGVYKLSHCDGKPSLKISENVEKVILPGPKKIYRYFDENNMMYADGICLQDEEVLETMHHPHQPGKSSQVGRYRREELHQKVMSGGQVLVEKKPYQEVAAYLKSRLQSLPEEHQRFDNPHIYKVGISESLRHLRDELLKEKKQQVEKTRHAYDKS